MSDPKVMENVDCIRTVGFILLEKQVFEGDQDIAGMHNIPAMFHHGCFR